MNSIKTVRKIRACEGETAAQLLLEKYAEEKVAKVNQSGSATGYVADLEKAITSSLEKLEKMSNDDLKALVEKMSNDERAIALYYAMNPESI